MPPGVTFSGSPYPWLVEMCSISREPDARAESKMNWLLPHHWVKKPNTAGCLPTWELNSEVDVDPESPVKTLPGGGPNTSARAAGARARHRRAASGSRRRIERPYPRGNRVVT